MTREEIEKARDELQLPTGQTMGMQDHEELDRIIADFGVALVLQAYEEAAKKVDAGKREPFASLTEIAASIRSLADSLERGRVDGRAAL